jgi:hypothetical protein
MRAMIWVRTAQFEGWACSECAWIFNPSGPPVGDSLDEMKQDFERERDKGLASHVCAQHPTTKVEKPGASNTKDRPSVPRKSENRT